MNWVTNNPTIGAATPIVSMKMRFPASDARRGHTFGGQGPMRVRAGPGLELRPRLSEPGRAMLEHHVDRLALPA